MKNCIVHIPYKLDENAKSAPMLRPRMLIKAFESNGYNVEVISGYSSERKQKIKELKKNIKSGIKYDFLYAESSTMPTALSDADHIPRHIFADFLFFKYAKKNGIKIGLFYRDIYWMFDAYKNAVSKLKRIIAISFYKYDLYQYRKYVDLMYLPTSRMKKYITNYFDESKIDYLPPGCEMLNQNMKPLNSTSIKVFYVGGLGGDYQISSLVQACANVNECELTICCRELEWENEKGTLEKFFNDNIHVIHKNNDELLQYYEQSDICSLMFLNGKYRDMAMPYKCLEYLSYLKPSIATTGTACGDFVESNDIGWVIDYDAESISRLISELINEPGKIKQKQINCISAREKNTWECRALKVAKDLR